MILSSVWINPQTIYFGLGRGKSYTLLAWTIDVWWSQRRGEVLFLATSEPFTSIRHEGFETMSCYKSVGITSLDSSQELRIEYPSKDKRLCSKYDNNRDFSPNIGIYDNEYHHYTSYEILNDEFISLEEHKYFCSEHQFPQVLNNEKHKSTESSYLYNQDYKPSLLEQRHKDHIFEESNELSSTIIEAMPLHIGEKNKKVPPRSESSKSPNLWTYT